MSLGSQLDSRLRMLTTANGQWNAALRAPGKIDQNLVTSLRTQIADHERTSPI